MGLKIPSKLKTFFKFFEESFKSKINNASDFPDLAANTILFPSDDHDIPGFNICNSSNSDVLFPLIIFLTNSESVIHIR